MFISFCSEVLVQSTDPGVFCCMPKLISQCSPNPERPLNCIKCTSTQWVYMFVSLVEPRLCVPG